MMLTFLKNTEERFIFNEDELMAKFILNLKLSYGKKKNLIFFIWKSFKHFQVILVFVDKIGNNYFIKL